MSIHVEIQARLSEGRLVEFETFVPIRRMLLLPTVFSAFSEAHDPDSDEAVDMTYVQADIENYITNGRVTVSFQKEPDATFRRLSPKRGKPPNVWEMRTQKPKPGSRLFGLFAAPNVFIGTDIQPRDMISKNFEAEMKAANSEWRKLFGCFQPLVSENHHDYITEKAHRLHER